MTVVNAVRSSSLVCEALQKHWGMTMFELFDRGRGKILKHQAEWKMRRLACWAIYEISGCSYPELAQWLDYDTHTMVMAYVKDAKRHIDTAERDALRDAVIALIDSGQVGPRAEPYELPPPRYCEQLPDFPNPNPPRQMRHTADEVIVYRSIPRDEWVKDFPPPLISRDGKKCRY